ncbi:MAG: fimbrial protein, partial [Firmicutes bacterium]|nr:fimbrial protein [Bacillota bacterium]
MKKFKSFVSVLLTVVMIMSMTFAAQADETTKEEITYSITIENNASGHTYEAYQIFAGDLYDNILSNITWGSGISEQGQAALGDAAALAKTIEGISDASTYAEQFAEYLTVPAGTTNILNEGKYVISGLEPGYYLVKDKDDSLAGKNDSYTSYILKVVKNVEVAPKSDVPSVEKKVKDTNDSIGETTEWQDSADYDIGDSVPFR